MSEGRTNTQAFWHEFCHCSDKNLFGYIPPLQRHIQAISQTSAKIYDDICIESRAACSARCGATQCRFDMHTALFARMVYQNLRAENEKNSATYLFIYTGPSAVDNRAGCVAYGSNLRAENWNIGNL